jgi:hypothetical protein
MSFSYEAKGLWGEVSSSECLAFNASGNYQLKTGVLSEIVPNARLGALHHRYR